MVDDSFEDIVARAELLKGAARAQFLDRACGDDTARREKVETMLGCAASEPEHPEPESAGTPATLGRYTILRELGRGGMGRVYLGIDPMLERQVAIKVLLESGARSAVELDRFRREARMLARLEHPNIAVLHAFEVEDRTPLLIMEYVVGETLEARLATGPLPTAEAVKLCRQISAGLAAAHKQGVIHRDLKPGNLCITDAGTVKILDFGLAKLTPERGSQATLTGTGQIIGSPGYMSPEHLRGQPLDHRTDIWSFGCVLFECLTGRPAFGGNTAAERFASALTLEPDLGSLSDSVPPALVDLLRRCLEKEVEARLPRMAHAQRILAALIESGTLAGESRGAHSRIDAGNARASSHAPASSLGDSLELRAARHNLPMQLTGFVGRQRELEELRGLLSEGPLLTLTGLGGAGKTRLALEVAEHAAGRFTDGVWLVPLAAISDAEDVAAAVGMALELKEEPAQTIRDVLRDFIAGKDMLIVLDNCEHVIEGCAGLATELLRIRSELRILATSRRSLGVPGETVFSVQPMSLPGENGERSVEELRDFEAVQLFADRARAARLDFTLGTENAAAVARICRQLDGIPLALELAAARLRAMSIDDLAAQIDDRLRPLAFRRRDELQHHQTLRALFDWSYDQLPAAEQALFRGLSVFAGSWTLESAMAVCGGEDVGEWQFLDLHSSLVDKSLIDMVPASDRTAGTRYHMLQTVGAYAREQLATAGENETLERRHRDHFVALAEQTESRSRAGDETAFLDRLASDHDNLLAALESARESDTGVAMRLANVTTAYWSVRGYWSEGLEICARVLARTAGEAPTPERCRLLLSAASLELRRTRLDHAAALYEEARAASTGLANHEDVSTALAGLGSVAQKRSQYVEARGFFEQSLALCRQFDDRRGLSHALYGLGNVCYSLADFQRSKELFEEALELGREGADQHGVASSLNALGNIANKQGHYAEGRARFEEALAIFHELGDQQNAANLLNNLGTVAYYEGDHAQSRDYFEQSLAIRRELDDDQGIAVALRNVGAIAEVQDRWDEARAFQEESLKLARRLGDDEGVAHTLGNMVRIALSLERPAEALEAQRERLRIWRQLANPSGMLASLESCGPLALALGAPRWGARLLGAAAALREGTGAPLSPTEAKTLHQESDALRAMLGEEEYASAFEGGRQLPMEEAIQLALEPGDPPAA